MFDVHYHQVLFLSRRRLAISYLFYVINENRIVICSHNEPEKQVMLRCMVMYNVRKYTASTTNRYIHKTINKTFYNYTDYHPSNNMEMTK